MPEKQAEDETLKLIRLTDNKESKLFRWYDVFLGGSFFPFISIIMFLIFIEIFFMFVSESLTNRIVVGTSYLAVAIAVFTLLAQWGEENIVKVNFNRLEKCIEKNKKPLFKALIMMKAKNPKFDLEQIYDMNPSMFTEEKLLERLYD